MRKTIKYVLFSLFLLSLTSFSIHKFYVSIYQINYATDKKMIQITSRIFIDDMNKALENKYSKKTHLGEENETIEDVALMNKYLVDNFTIKVNGENKTYKFISKEIENNVIIGYYSIRNIPKINSLEVQNTVLLDLGFDQQNIIQSKLYGEKNSLLLTSNIIKGVLK